MDLNKRLEELKPYQLNCNVFDVYSYNGLSMQDLLCQFFTKINECVNVSNGTLDLAEWLVNEGLSQEVVKKLMIWLEDGTLENLINVNLFKSLNDKIDGLSSELETKANKVNVGEYINVVEYAKQNNKTLSETIELLKNDNKLFFPSGVYNVDSLDGVRFLKGESENSTIIKVNKDIQCQGYTVWENIQIDLNKNGSLKAPPNNAQATELLRLYQVIINNAINGLETTLGTHLVNCEIMNCVNYGILVNGTDCSILNTTILKTGLAGLKVNNKSLRFNNCKLFLTNETDFSTGYSVEDYGGTGYYNNVEIQQSRGGALKLASYGTTFKGATDGSGWYHPNIVTDVLIEGEYNKVDVIQKTGSNFDNNHTTSWKTGLVVSGINNEVNSLLYTEDRIDLGRTFAPTADTILNNRITINGCLLDMKNSIHYFTFSTPITKYNEFKSTITLSPNTVVRAQMYNNINTFHGLHIFKAIYQSTDKFKIGITITDGTISNTIEKEIESSWGKYKMFSLSVNKYTLLNGFESKGGNKTNAKMYLQFISTNNNSIDIFGQHGTVFEVQ